LIKFNQILHKNQAFKEHKLLTINMLIIIKDQRNNKSKYRGLIKQRIWTYCRCLWINHIRIPSFTKQIYQRTLKTIQKPVKNLFWFDYFGLQKKLTTEFEQIIIHCTIFIN
jgi:hypothetical protein